MTLYLDTTTNQFITDPLFKSPLPELSFKRGDSAKINLQFISGTTALSAVSGKSIKFGIKPAGDYDGAYLVYADTYVTNGVNYVMEPSFNTTTLNALLSGDVPSVAGMLEVTTSDDGVTETSSNTQGVTILNDVNKLGEAPPYIIPDPVEWLAENSIVQGKAYNAFSFDNTEGYVFKTVLAKTSVLSGTGGTDYRYSTDGTTTVALTGYWLGVYYDTGDSLYRLQVYSDATEDVYWLGGGSNPNVLPVGGTWTDISETNPDIEVLINPQTDPASGNFRTDGSALYVNLGTLTVPTWFKFEGTSYYP